MGMSVLVDLGLVVEFGHDFANVRLLVLALDGRRQQNLDKEPQVHDALYAALRHCSEV